MKPGPASILAVDDDEDICRNLSDILADLVALLPPLQGRHDVSDASTGWTQVFSTMRRAAARASGPFPRSLIQAGTFAPGRRHGSLLLQVESIDDFLVRSPQIP
jgi:hypothetical protein